MKFRVHFNRSGSGIPACRNAVRDEEVFNLTSDRTKVTCVKCVGEIAKMVVREQAAR